MTWLKNNKWLSVILVLLFGCGVVFTFIFLDMFLNESHTKSNKNISALEGVEEVSQPLEMTASPFGDGKTSLTETDIQDYLHGMSHQKVKAEEKWTHYFITEERIQFLLQVVEKGDYEHKPLYLDILTRRAEGDFSKADQDHNAIWQLQGGTIGKATDVFTEEEEDMYVQEHKDTFK
ncbi:DUF6241 domain-containing protein [Bacillus sp. FJAT-47783]|uniref:DUF6241 domain-containing protein n=1 Tax=Bacillus sp. FJAT-47783 TaxID=2922712 RepID=UPI001FAB533B|nr:DUF6241 domain-containing protein [Bacillus sp. FJAT-47783]